jgi:hypothetical protein
VGDHQYPLGCCAELKNPQLQRSVPITEKHVELKTVKMSQLEFGTGGWPPISTWIMMFLVVLGEVTTLLTLNLSKTNL